MLQLLRRYLRLMKSHDFSYNYTDDMNVYFDENDKRVNLIMLKSALILTSRGRFFVEKAEKKYGQV